MNAPRNTTELRRGSNVMTNSRKLNVALEPSHWIPVVVPSTTKAMSAQISA